MPHLGAQELIIILVIVLVLFGSTKLPQLAKGLGEGLREFKKATKEQDELPTKSKELADKEPKTDPPLA
jgi:sec-independent protein translocase protein TatA